MDAGGLLRLPSVDPPDAVVFGFGKSLSAVDEWLGFPFWTGGEAGELGGWAAGGFWLMSDTEEGVEVSG